MGLQSQTNAENSLNCRIGEVQSPSKIVNNVRKKDEIRPNGVYIAKIHVLLTTDGVYKYGASTTLCSVVHQVPWRKHKTLKTTFRSYLHVSMFELPLAFNVHGQRFWGKFKTRASSQCSLGLYRDHVWFTGVLKTYQSTLYLFVRYKDKLLKDFLCKICLAE